MNTAIGSYVCTVLLPNRSSGSVAKVARPHWWRLAIASSNPYHPERYYMRGPGPKWREKHGPGGEKPAHSPGTIAIGSLGMPASSPD
jgi:hypothetical protein